MHDPGRCAPPVPISIVEFHSKDDVVIPFDGGIFPDSSTGLQFPGTIETIVRWAIFNRCNGVLNFGTQPTLDLDSDIPGEETTVNRVEGCPEGIDIELWSMEGVTHEPFTFTDALAEETVTFMLEHAR